MKIILTKLKTLCLISAIALGSEAIRAEVTTSKDLADAQAAIIMINHVNWVVNNVKNTNNVGMLELEYEGISLNKLNLQSIKDQEVIDQITNICNYITERRISDGEQKMLKLELNHNLNNAIYSAFPSPGAIVAATPSAIAYNLVQSSISSYMSYRKAIKQLEIQSKRQNWELEKDAIRELNKMNIDLLNQQWRLMQSYKLDDYWRVPEEQIKELLNRVNSQKLQDRPSMLFEYLNHPFQRNKYQKLPVYWYYLGITAEKVKNEKVAIEAYNRYQKEFYQILRNDRMAASVAMNKILIMIKGDFNPQDIIEQLKIIEKNAQNEWTFLYFCANIYFNNLNDKNSALQVLDHAINILRFQFQDGLLECKSLCNKKNLALTNNIIPDATSLITCSILRLRICGEENNTEEIKKFLNLLQKDLASSCFGILSFAKKLPISDIANYLMPNLRSTFIDYQFDDRFWKNPAPYRFVLNLPLSWFFAGRYELEFYIHFDDGTEPLQLELHPRIDKKQNPVILENGLVRFVYDCPSYIVRKASPSQIEVKFAHKFYPLSVFFDAQNLKNAKVRDINILRMNIKVAKYKRHTINVK